jgi:DNA polymerase-3 subunit delta'
MRPFETICPWLADALATIESAARADRLGHGWLIAGPADTGKRDLAYVLALRLLGGAIGAAPPRPASPAEIVARYAALDEPGDLHPDLHRLRPEEDKLTISVDQVRQMTADLALTPHMAGVKVVVIELAERMTTAAANALLKSLEEPTPDTYLFLLTERPGRLAATIRSRCQRLAIRRPPAAVTRDWLERAGLVAAKLPAALLSKAPLVAARAALEHDNITNYKEIYSNIDELYQGRADVHSIAESWRKGDTALALDCLAETLQARIRSRLIPERSTPVTEHARRFDDNRIGAVSSEQLFEGLEMAENLREQLGRGINVELALKALLLGLEPTGTSRVQP